LGKTPQVFHRFRGSANRRVDLHLPLIASILGRRPVARGETKSCSTTINRFGVGLHAFRFR
jgi:hypothetical protein